MGIVFSFTLDRVRVRARNRVRLSQWLEKFSAELEELVEALPPEELHWQLAWLRDGLDAAFIETMSAAVANTDRDDCPGGRHDG